MASETTDTSSKEEELSPLLFLAAVAAPAADAVDAPDADAIVVTATREPVAADQAPASATLFDGGTLAALGLPGVSDVLRLSPGVSVSTTGPRGTQTQLRIRG